MICQARVQDFHSNGTGLNSGWDDNDEGDDCFTDLRGETKEDDAPGSSPWLEDLHKYVREYVGAEVVDGDNLRYVPDAVGSPYFPWANLTEMLVSVWAMICRPSRKSLQKLLDLLRVEDSSGCKFDPRDVPPSAEHLVSRMRTPLPLLRVLRRVVRGKGGHAAEIVECPFNLIFQRILDCPRIVEELLKNPGGKRMSAEEQSRSQIPDFHFTPIATRESDGARKSFMHGDIKMASSHTWPGMCVYCRGCAACSGRHGDGERRGFWPFSAPVPVGCVLLAKYVRRETAQLSACTGMWRLVAKISAAGRE